MTPFERAYIPPVERALIAQSLAEQGYPADELLALVDDDSIFLNDKYQVTVRRFQCDFGDMAHLSIKRRDREPIRDWREMQAIKNELVGPEFEAVELYPAESRLVDTANQYHLWALLTPGLRFPFGFQTRLVSGESKLPDLPKAKQRER